MILKVYFTILKYTPMYVQGQSKAYGHKTIIMSVQGILKPVTFKKLKSFFGFM